MTAYFNLCGAWGALNLMMIHYSYVEKNLIEEQVNNSPSNLAYVLKFLPDITWDILVKRTLRVGSTVTKHSLVRNFTLKTCAFINASQTNLTFIDVFVVVWWYMSILRQLFLNNWPFLHQFLLCGFFHLYAHFQTCTHLLKKDSK